MSFALAFTFWSISLLLTCTPGADWAYVLSSTIKHKSPLPSVAGLVLGYLGLVIVVAIGAAALIEGIPGALETLTIVGALYLIWVGISIFRNPPRAQTSDDAVPTSARKQLITGAGVSFLNPKALLTYLVLLPQFTTLDGSWPMILQLSILGLLHTLNCGGIYLVIGYSARKVLTARPGASKAIGLFSGGVMVIIGLLLLGEQVMKWLS